MFAALPAVHADIAGRFSVKGKLLCWKTFMEEEDTITAFGSLGATVHFPRRDIGPCEDVYKPGLSAWNRHLTSQATKMAYMFRKKSGESDRLPPNEGSFYEAILRAHYHNDSLAQ